MAKRRYKFPKPSRALKLKQATLLQYLGVFFVGEAGLSILFSKDQQAISTLGRVFRLIGGGILIAEAM